MNRDEAKLRLQAYRPGGRDAGDPYFAEALACLPRDPELAGWFKEQQSLDEQIAGGLQQLRVPSRLKAEILAEHRKDETSTPIWWQAWFGRQSTAGWAFAGVILVVLGFSLLEIRAKSSAAFADYSAQMVNTAMNDPHHVDRGTSSLPDGLAVMSLPSGEDSLALPPQLAGGRGLTGCRAFSWRGQNVGMLCFKPQNGGHVDLFVTRAARFTDPPPLDQPAFIVCNGSMTAGWTHGGEAYLAVSHDRGDGLRDLWSAEKVSFKGLPRAVKEKL
jgi:hypothetical protein